MHPVKAMLFDAHGTLFDVYSVSRAVERLFPGRGERLALQWRDKRLEATRPLTRSGRHLPLWVFTCAALRHAIARFEVLLDAKGEQHLRAQHRQLSAFPENKAVLATLKRRGVPTGILSNGDPAMLAAAVQRACLREVLSFFP